jgi:hypothetical protein
LVVVPRSTSFIAGDAFPSSCAVMLAGPDCNTEFRAYDAHGELGSSDAFRRRTSGVRELAKKESGDSDDEERRTPSERMGNLPK